MLIPDIAPMNDTPMSNLLTHFAQLHATFQNSFGGDAAQVLQSYQRESLRAAQSLSFSFSADDIEQIMLTRRHWLLMSTVAGVTPDPVIHDLVRHETDERGRQLHDLLQQFRSIEQRWGQSTVTLVAPDTNIYLHQDTFFDKIDWRTLAAADDVRVMVPMRVVRELDKHKNGARNAVVSDTCNESVRIRAGRTIRRLRELLADPNQVATLESGVEVELIADTLQHVPVDDADGEIIRRVLAASRLIQRTVAIVTADGGMQFQAKLEGLAVIGV